MTLRIAADEAVRIGAGQGPIMARTPLWRVTASR